jgi:hypothetical protein
MRRLVPWLALGTILACGCGQSSGQQQAGSREGGGDGSPSGSRDSNVDGSPSSGLADGGIGFPSSAGWTFLGPQDGAPSDVEGLSADQGGNVWVAGGEAGLFVLRAGSTTFDRFTMADGLRPYGYMADGSAPTGTPYLDVISVAGGPPGTVFVGYEGKPAPAGVVGCEDNWDGPNPDPSIYKSGDADRVTLSGSGIAVVHYDIFSGPHVVRAEPAGREKLCNILRIVYDPANKSVWFGGNHGFAWGNPTFAGNPTCDGQIACAGTLEHVHPAINAYASNTGNALIYLTEDYRGVAVDPVTHDVWFGGANRTTKFHFATTGGSYFTAEVQTECGDCIPNRIDVWPDLVEEPNYPRPKDRVDDVVSGIAAMADGTAWVGSAAWGLAHLDKNGVVIGTIKDQLVSPNVSALAVDPKDQSLWAGALWGGGITRIAGKTISHYGSATFGPTLVGNPITDIQMTGSGASRRVLVAFGPNGATPGAIAIYAGN